MVVMCFSCDEPFPLGQILARVLGRFLYQRQGLERALCLIGNHRASGQGHRRCLNSASLSEGSLPRNQESETPSVHEANSLHPSKTVAHVRWRCHLAKGRSAGDMRRHCVEHETWSCRLNSVVVDTGRKIHVTASYAYHRCSSPCDRGPFPRSLCFIISFAGGAPPPRCSLECRPVVGPVTFGARASLPIEPLTIRWIAPLILFTALVVVVKYLWNPFVWHVGTFCFLEGCCLHVLQFV